MASAWPVRTALDASPTLLRELTRAGELSHRLRAGIAAQVGIVHGALTTDAVLVSSEGRAVVLGFRSATSSADRGCS